MPTLSLICPAGPDLALAKFKGTAESLKSLLPKGQYLSTPFSQDCPHIHLKSPVKRAGLSLTCGAVHLQDGACNPLHWG